MYVNKCIKCGAEFETKNPKRVICPNCLYADKGSESSDEKPMQSYSSYSSYSTESRPRSYDRPQQGGYNRNNNYQRRDNRGGQQGGYQRRDNNNRPQRRPDNRGGFRNNYASGSKGGFQQKRANKRPKPQKAAKPLLISKEQLEQIEVLYKAMLPLPNPDAHEVIAQAIDLEPKKVFFGINLVRQKLMLPKLPFPKRKLAISPDQLFAIKNLYEPLLPLPPIGCHKIIAAQLKMDEWRVHVGIGLIRSQMGLQRWNQDRTDIPEEFKKKMEEHQAAAEAKAAAKAAEKAAKKAAEEAANDAQETVQDAAPVETETETAAEEKPKRGRKPKKVEEPAES